ncbi:MAG: MFS transporter [Arcanobacterium sp.]|nr:MFS transporter [Arcanobacterium sp.]
MKQIKQIRIFLKAWESLAFRRLLLVRLCSQLGDGLFQIGLASLFFFAPERLASLSEIALAFVVLLLPFTIIGPFASPVLDRWSRRQVLVFGNFARAILTLGALALFWFEQNSFWVYLLALIAIGINRFLLAALSAALPRTVPTESLLIANSIVPSLGGIAAAVGAVFGAIAKFLIFDGVGQDLFLLLFAAICFGGAAFTAKGFSLTILGPETSTTLNSRHVVGNVISDLAESARVLWQLRIPAYALGAMALHRCFYALNLISFILLSRSETFALSGTENSSGFADFAAILGFSFLGNGIAIFITAWIGGHLSPIKWVTTCIVVTSFAQALLTLGPLLVTINLAAVFLGFGTQGAKIAVDTIVHRETPDNYRGRAFIWYDMLYNFAFICAAGVALIFLPNSGWSFNLFAGMFFTQLTLGGFFFYFADKNHAKG